MKHTLRLHALIAASLIILAAGCVPVQPPQGVQVPLPPAPTQVAAAAKPTRKPFGAANATLNDNDIATLLNSHNQWRAKFGSPPLVWDADVAAVAQDWAEQIAARGVLEHRPDNKFGENAWAGTSGAFPLESVVDDWGSEVNDYDMATNTCADGKVCGHFTQVVWSKSARLGCGRAAGDDGNDYVICNYDPPGNFVGESPFAAGAKPAIQPTVQPTQEAPTEIPATTEPTIAPTEVPAAVAATEVPATEVAATEVPPTEVPATGVLPTEVPATEVAATEVPATEVPATEVAATEVPPTEVPATAVPPTEVPPTAEPTTAPANAGGLSDADKQVLLDKHNEWRAKYNTPALVWDDAVALVAQDWANQMAASGVFAHRQGNKYGENIWAGSAGFFPITSSIDNWGGEEQNYDVNTNTCATGKVCGHFTQVVWRNTARLGCGKATGNGNDYVVCNYDPPGNFVGESPFGN